METSLSAAPASPMPLYDSDLEAFLALEDAGEDLFADPFAQLGEFPAQEPMQQQIPMQAPLETAAFGPEQTSSESSSGSPPHVSSEFDIQATTDPMLAKDVAYPQVATLRAHQRAQGWNLHGLSRVQLGLEIAERCHHITMNQTIKGGPLSHRVRVCKRCCGEDTHIELGTYLDQESAMLVNDAHELLHHRYAKLLVLTPQDVGFLHMFNARRYNRGKAEVKPVLDILKERDLEREQRRTQQTDVATTLKRRRTGVQDGYRSGALATIASTPNALVDVDKDSLIHKLSSVLDRMVMHVAVAFKKQPSMLHDRFRYLFSKVLTPNPMDTVTDPHERSLATVTSVLLSSYGDTSDMEIRYLVEALDNTYFFTEDTDLYCQVFEIMDEAAESPIPPELHVVNQVISKYLDEIKTGMWRYLQESKFPLLNDPDKVEEDTMICETNELLATSDRKRQILSRMRTFLQDLPARYEETHPALETTRNLIKSCTMYLAWFTVGVTSCRLKSADLTGNLEHVDVALTTISQLVECGEDMAPLEQLHLLAHTLALYNSIYSRRRQRGAAPVAPSATAQYAFLRLIALSKELGLLPGKENKQAGVASSSELATSMEAAAPQSNEWKCLVFGYIFEYSFIHKEHVQWPDGMTFKDLIQPFRDTLRQVQEDAMRNGIAFVMPYAWRALYVAMHACGQACLQYSDCVQCAYNLMQMSFNILTEGGKRFGFARFYADRAEGILKDMHRYKNGDLNL